MVFFTVDNKQYWAVIPERGETNEVIPVTTPSLLPKGVPM